MIRTRQIILRAEKATPPYQTTEVVTADRQVYNGLVNFSLMPIGLLNDAGEQELADLYAYLKSLSK